MKRSFNPLRSQTEFGNEKPFSEKQLKYFHEFANNLREGIEYYKNLYSDFESKLAVMKEDLLKEMEEIRMSLNDFAPVAA